MSDISLLPSSASELQHALAQVTAQATDLNHNAIRHSRDPLRCDARLLPWLAWENSIDDAEGWLFAESEAAKRAIIAGYIEKHAVKGTPSAIRRLFRDLGLGEIDIIENVGALSYDGSQTHNGQYFYGYGAGAWATYSVVVKERPITNDQAALLTDILRDIAPARCHLIRIHYTAVAIRYNGKADYDNTYNHGAI